MGLRYYRMITVSAGQELHLEGIEVDVDHIYDRKKIEPLNQSEIASYLCVVCGKILRNPQQVSCCGRRLCRVCVDGLRR